MGICRFVLKAIVLAFFALSAWNTLQHVEKHSAVFSETYKNLEVAIGKHTGLKLPKILQHSSVHTLKENVIKYFAWIEFVIVLASLFLCSGFMPLVGLAHLVKTFFLLHSHHFFSGNIGLLELEQIALPVSLFVATFVFACCGNSKCTRSKSCGASSRSSCGASSAKTEKSKRH